MNWLRRWQVYVRNMRRVAEDNYCHPDNECWPDCYAYARETEKAELQRLPQLIHESTEPWSRLG